jgi:cytidylyltransferase-like protein
MKFELTLLKELSMATEPKNRRIFITATGAGAGAQKVIWSTPGCSSYFAGAAFPYGADQTNELLGFKPDKYVSEDTALDLAMASYMRAWNGPGCDAIGIGLSASVASLERHRGEHEIFAAVVGSFGALTYHEVLKKGKGEEARRRDGNKADKIITGLIRLATRGGASNINAPTVATDKAIERFFYKPFFDVDGSRYHRLLYPNPGPLYFGAFNPVHKGHRQVAEAAGHNTIFGITQDGPHKESLTLANLLQRSKMLKGKRILFTRGDPLYIDKARAKPESTFVLGVDALSRMLDPKWCPVLPMLYEFSKLGTKFLVAPRIVDGRPVYLEDVLRTQTFDPELMTSLFTEIKVEPSSASSTEIRKEIAIGA